MKKTNTMKKLNVFYLLPFVLFFIACGGGETGKKEDKKADGKIEILNKYTKGEVYYVTLKWDEKVTSTDESGKENSTPINMESVWKYEVLDVDENGVSTIKGKYDRMKFGGFNSEDSATFNDPSAMMFSGMMKYEITMKLDTRGNVLDLTGADGMYSFGAPDSLLDDNKIMMENLQNAMGVFPDVPVAVGEKWERTVDITYGYPCSYKNEYTLKSADKGVAVIDINSTMSPLKDIKPTIFPGGYELYQELSGTQTGTVEIDIEKGKVLKSVYDVKISGTATGKMAGKEMSKVPLSTELKMEYTVQFGEQ